MMKRQWSVLLQVNRLKMVEVRKSKFSDCKQNLIFRNKFSFQDQVYIEIYTRILRNVWTRLPLLSRKELFLSLANNRLFSIFVWIQYTSTMLIAATSLYLSLDLFINFTTSIVLDFPWSRRKLNKLYSSLISSLINTLCFLLRSFTLNT